MLALMGVAAGASRATLVFDEVDAGIGGQTARAVGDALRDARRRPAGALHHPPAADRVARRAPLLDRQGPVARARRARPSRSSPTTRSSRSSCGCSAPTRTPTARSAATPRSCCGPALTHRGSRTSREPRRARRRDRRPAADGTGVACRLGLCTPPTRRAVSRGRGAGGRVITSARVRPDRLPGASPRASGGAARACRSRRSPAPAGLDALALRQTPSTTAAAARRRRPRGRPAAS